MVSPLCQYLDTVEAAKVCPGTPHYVTIWRWARQGLQTKSGRRVYLRYVRVGGKLCTTEDWLHQFFEALAAEDMSVVARQVSNSPRRSKRSQAKAEADDVCDQARI